MFSADRENIRESMEAGNSAGELQVTCDKRTEVLGQEQGRIPKAQDRAMTLLRRSGKDAI
jgi:hypothetical protein